MLNFFALCCSKFYFELSGFSLLILDCMRSRNSPIFGLLLLNILINEMSGVNIPNNMTEFQILAISSSSVIVKEAAFYSKIRGLNENCKRLVKTLCPGTMGGSLLKLLVLILKFNEFDFDPYAKQIDLSINMRVVNLVF